ncbi:hypothetical protein Hokovirus_5_18 [Hokovirus HKV1]|uniref:Uncharacterized protein n=1 Tax=Hokovirus HKV1 TaxID=1977638 RepID=A0A1V0SHC5_9VIRU|nr:hypothetical protein Hokovirus_5_18 [Hokovirus HKV1]
MNENVLICGYENYVFSNAPIFESKNICSVNNSNMFNKFIFNNNDMYSLAKGIYFMDWHPNNEKKNFINPYADIRIVNNGKTEIYFNACECDIKLESCCSLYEYFGAFFEFEDLKIKKHDCESI